MKHLILKIATALLSFGIGLSAAGVTNIYRRTNIQRLQVPAASLEMQSVKVTDDAPRFFYINTNTQWEKPSRETGQSFESVRDSTVIAFFATGKFLHVRCTLRGDNLTGETAISTVSDVIVSVGTWARNPADGVYTTVMRRVYPSHEAGPNNVQATESRWSSRQLAEPEASFEAHRNGIVFESDGETYTRMTSNVVARQLAYMMKEYSH
jgi:hypothetical protein